MAKSVKFPAFRLVCISCSRGKKFSCKADIFESRHPISLILGMVTHNVGCIVKNVSLFPSSIRSVMQKYLAERNEITFDKIFNQKIDKRI